MEERVTRKREATSANKKVKSDNNKNTTKKEPMAVGGTVIYLFIQSFLLHFVAFYTSGICSFLLFHHFNAIAIFSCLLLSFYIFIPSLLLYNVFFYFFLYLLRTPLLTAMPFNDCWFHFILFKVFSSSDTYTIYKVYLIESSYIFFFWIYRFDKHPALWPRIFGSSHLHFFQQPVSVCTDIRRPGTLKGGRMCLHFLLSLFTRGPVICSCLLADGSLSSFLGSFCA